MTSASELDGTNVATADVLCKLFLGNELPVLVPLLLELKPIVALNDTDEDLLGTASPSGQFNPASFPL